MTVITPYQSDLKPGRDGFAQLLHAEWTKFRTVRGWLIGMLAAIVVIAGLGLLLAGSTRSSCQQVGSSGQARSGTGCGPTFPLGPAGEPVTDSFYFVHQPLTGNGSLTVRLAAMTGLLPPANSGNSPQGPQGPADTVPGLEEWAKTGILIKASLAPGSAYAAMLVAGGHGARMQWNYTGDTPGLPGAVGPRNPRWLRLSRVGDVITGYDSADGSHWTEVAAVTLPGLPASVQAGLFATSPDANQPSLTFGGTVTSTGGSTQATGVFDHVSGAGLAAGPWTGTYLGAADASGIGRYRQSGGQLSVTGSGDIAPVPAGHGGPDDAATTITDYLQGTFVALIVFAVIAALFITAEYRRGLIRVTFTASRGRGRVLAAKAIVVAAVSFVTALAGAAVAVLASAAIIHARGYAEFPIRLSTELRVIAGTAAVAAVAAVLALAVGAIVRRGAAAVAIVIVAIVLPYFLALTAAVPLGAADWLLRVTPAAGFAVQQPYPAYRQVTMIYSALSGYFPLSGPAGFAVLCGWALAALTVADLLLRRRDA